MKKLNTLLALMLALSATATLAQEAVAPAKTATYVAPPWTHTTPQLSRAQIDALLAKPSEVLVIDVRRPDEITAKGTFPVYLSIQVKDVEKSLAYIPRDRVIVTVSNRAHRAGDVGDLLTTKGFKVAGAAGSQDYEDQGGTITRITPPPPRPAPAPAK